MSSLFNNPQTGNRDSAASRKLHPEELEISDAITVGSIRCQFPGFYWCGSDWEARPVEEPITVLFWPERVVLLRVESIALPFVLCLSRECQPELLDVRQVELYRLPAYFATATEELWRAKEKAERRAKTEKKRKK